MRCIRSATLGWPQSPLSFDTRRRHDGNRLCSLRRRVGRVAGETIRPFFRTALGVENKSLSGGFDPVTAADRAAETAMRTLIKRTFPEHGILGEEFDADRPDAEYVWVLDPIDGTKSFICGMPAWGTLIALTRRGEPIYGMMYQPFTREHFTGDGSAASYRGPAGDRALRARPCAELEDAVLLTTSPLLMRETDRKIFQRVEQAGAALALWRRLLRLLHARRRPRRSRHRDRAQAL